ncbi:ead/Ea22-like family protein [Escherichia coli]|nr:ead/Ea22-like family protein [Escherichia coli]
MTALNKQALRSKARSASAGEWIKESGDGWEAICSAEDQANGNFIIAHFEGPDAQANREFVQVANPDTVLALLDELESAEKRNAELQRENVYIRNRHKELDLLIGKNILVMQAAIIEWQATGDAKNGLAWIYNTLFGPGELPDESEKDAQAYFDRKYAPIDEELMALHKWFWEQSEAERAAAGIGVKGE